MQVDALQMVSMMALRNLTLSLITIVLVLASLNCAVEGSSFCEQYVDLVALNTCPDIATRDDVVLESYTVRLTHRLRLFVCEAAWSIRAKPAYLSPDSNSSSTDIQVAAGCIFIHCRIPRLPSLLVIVVCANQVMHCRVGA